LIKHVNEFMSNKNDTPSWASTYVGIDQGPSYRANTDDNL